MLDLYAWPTPNAHKVSILLEEIGMPYNVIPVDISRGEQFEPEFLKISPNNRMPALVDHDAPGGPLAIFESGAIMMYIAEKSGRFLPAEPRARFAVMQWVMWQMGGLGPMLGQAFHFRNYAPEKLPYAIDRYTKEAGRLFGVLDKQLAGRDFIAGDYSIADMACYSWTLVAERLGFEAEEFPAMSLWQARMAERPGVQRGMALLDEKRQDPSQMDEEARRNLFGDRQHSRN